MGLAFLFAAGVGVGFWVAVLYDIEKGGVTAWHTISFAVSIGFWFALAPFLSAPPEEGVTKKDVVFAKSFAKLCVFAPLYLAAGSFVGARWLSRISLGKM